MPRSICGPDEYFDALDENCVHCSVICRPNPVSQDFCLNNCPGYTPAYEDATTKVLSSAATTSALTEASLVTILLMLLVVILAVVVIVGLVVFCVVLRRRRGDASPQKSASSSASGLDGADSRGIIGGDEYLALVPLAGDDRPGVDEGSRAAATATLRQMNTPQVRVGREMLICSVSLQPPTNDASSLPVTT